MKLTQISELKIFVLNSESDSNSQAKKLEIILLNSKDVEN